MADLADDLGIPNKLVRPASHAPQPAKTAAEPHAAPSDSALPPTPAFLRNNAQPASAPPPLPPRPSRTVTPTDSAIDARKLVVGQGCSLSGEISSCDSLVVEGSVQANLQSCQHMIIAETGLFDGNATIDDVEVFGRFEGDLAVHKRLLIRGTGRVSGTISYGQIEIEAGGSISGTIQAPQRRRYR